MSVPSSATNLFPIVSLNRPQARSRSRIRQPRDLDQTVTESRRPDADEPLAYPYSFDLSAHHGCVNALRFSTSSQGRWLASGGDDTRVLLWDTFADFDQISPVAAYEGPAANIFSIDFTADGKRVLATGLDSRIYVWDLERSGRSSRPGKPPDRTAPPSQVFSPHLDSCRRVTCHPQDPDSFLSASEDGTVSMVDARSPTDPKPLLRANQEYTDILWHPTSSNLFIASTNHSLKLYDRRAMSGDPYKNFVGQLTTYTTSLIKPKPTIRRSRPDISSLSFDETGRLLAGMMSKWFPTVWALDDPNPLAVLRTDRPLGEDGQRWGFKDTCTIKHGSFSNAAHSRDTYFVAGSDDFRCYGWKLDSIEELKSKRVRVDDVSGWLQRSGLDTTAYGRDPITIPLTLNDPTFVLGGHRSIPNTVSFHPTFPFICTSGVEKVIKIHSTRQLGHHRRAREPVTRRTPSEVRRKVLTVEELVADEEDRETLVMFDQLLLRNEDETDGLVWAQVGLSESSDDELDEDNGDGDSCSDESDL